MPGLRLLILDHLAKSFIYKIAINTFWKTSGLAPLGGGARALLARCIMKSDCYDPFEELKNKDFQSQN